MATHKPAEEHALEEHDHSKPAAKLKCGIIMPIAGFGTYSEGHWSDVLRIIKRAADTAGFESAMVSTGADVGVIHANIINNIYSNQMVVCDVSGKNANVMFELGLRLASKLPVIIIKDELTGYSFDTSPIQHIGYRSDLRLFETLSFQDELAQQIRGTYESSQKPNYKTFLDHFGTYTLAKVEDKAIDLNEFMSAIFTRLDAIEQRQITPDYQVLNNPRKASSEDDSIMTLQSAMKPAAIEYVGDKKIKNIKEFEKLLQEAESNFLKLFMPQITELRLSPAAFRKALRNAINYALNYRSGMSYVMTF